MASIVPTHHSVFADALELYDVFSLHRDGRNEVRVIGQPELRKNLVGERSYIVVRVNRLRPHAMGEVILRPSEVVWVRNGNVSRGTSKE